MNYSPIVHYGGNRMARTVSKTEIYIGYTIIIVLLLISGGILLKQSQYNPSIFKPSTFQTESPALTTTPSSPPSDLIQYAPDALTALTPAEAFGPENLSDKINGKAELYLSAGFIHLASQRLAAKEDSGDWMEAFVYDMGSIRGSFAVFSLQRRYEAKKIELSDFAYKSENGLFFVHGPYYVEIISSVAQERMTDLMLSFGDNFVRQTAVSHERIKELAYFPAPYFSEDSISLLPTNGFGFERFDSIFTAQYIMADTELTAFLSQRKSQTEAAELVTAYTSFLLANGGAEVRTSMDIPGAKLVEIMDTFELVFNQGVMLAGVHSAENRQNAEELALMLKQNLAGAGQ